MSHQTNERAHQKVIKAMDRLGFGLLTDGKTFYQKGCEISPRSGITFSMSQAYLIAQELTTDRQALSAEIEKLLKPGKHPDSYDEGFNDALYQFLDLLQGDTDHE